MAGFDPKKLTGTDWTVVGAAFIALISLFLPWYGASVAGFSASVDGFSTSYGWLGGLLIIGAGVYLALVRSGADVSKIGVGPTVVVLGAAALGTLIVIIRWVTLPSGSYALAAYTYGPKAGIYLTILAGLVEVGAAFLIFRRSGEKLPWDSSEAKPSTPPADPTPPPAS